MSGFRITPEFRARIRAMKWLDRWRYKRHARRWMACQSAIDALFDTYDCGAALINHVTGGRLNKLRDEQAFHSTAMKAIMRRYGYEV